MKVLQKMFNSKILSGFVLGTYMALIFYVSSLPNETLVSVRFTVNNVLVHIVEYAILGFFMSRVATQLTDNVYAIFSSSFLFSLLYGVSDEIHQLFVPTRHCTIVDVYADAVGSLAGVLLYLMVTKWMGRERS